MIREEIREELFRMQDVGYRDFQGKLIPTVDPKAMIGVRTPQLRKMAKEWSKKENIGEFLNDLPHAYFDENQLHAFFISGMKDFKECLDATEAFLPYVDNWATCDQMSPKVFRRHKKELLDVAKRWIASDQTYVIRFGVGMLMEHFLDEDFKAEYLELVAGIRSEEYYVNTMIAWYYATALAKQYDATIFYIEEEKLEKWTHNKAIQKAVESYRITPEQKEYLKGLKRR